MFDQVEPSIKSDVENTISSYPEVVMRKEGITIRGNEVVAIRANKPDIMQRFIGYDNYYRKNIGKRFRPGDQQK